MDGGVKVYAVENLIDADQKQVGGVPFQDRQVIALRDGNEITGLVLGSDPLDEVELAGHGFIVAGNGVPLAPGRS